jgi:hypothetical protein
VKWSETGRVGVLERDGPGRTDGARRACPVNWSLAGRASELERLDGGARPAGPGCVCAQVCVSGLGCV